MIALSGSGAYRGFHIGNAHGKIALWLDEDEARALADMFPLDDRGAKELHEAIESAYSGSEAS